MAPLLGMALMRNAAELHLLVLAVLLPQPVVHKRRWLATRSTPFTAPVAGSADWGEVCWRSGGFTH